MIQILIDIFQTIRPITTKKIWDKFNMFLAQKKIFGTRRIYYTRRMF